MNGAGEPRPRVLLVSPRPPRPDGQGDQRRAHEILMSLGAEWDVEVLSWLPDVNRGGVWRWARSPATLARALALSVTRPLQVACVQALAPPSIARRVASGGHARIIFVTDRAVPCSIPDRAVVDFVDDLGGAALRRGRASRGLSSLFWKWEGRRLRRLDRRLAEGASVAVAHCSADAVGISPEVRVVPLSVGTRPLPDVGDRVVFFGNLFYAPNHEAALWMCAELVPALTSLGVDAGRVLIAGRRPRPALQRAAATAGVELRADLDDLAPVLEEAAVVLAPMTLGSGTQYKILDAVGAGRACVVSPLANAGLGLVDGQSALVREREGQPFAEAVVSLLDHPEYRQTLAQEARAQIAHFLPDAVAATWRAALNGQNGKC